MFESYQENLQESITGDWEQDLHSLYALLGKHLDSESVKPQYNSEHMVEEADHN